MHDPAKSIRIGTMAFGRMSMESPKGDSVPDATPGTAAWELRSITDDFGTVVIRYVAVKRPTDDFGNEIDARSSRDRNLSSQGESE